MKVKEESKKSWLKAQHSEKKKRSWHPVPSLHGKWTNSEKLYFRERQITADGDCRHEIKRCLLLGRKVMTNLDSI